MSFKIFRISAPSQLDSAPVAVIKHYPLEKRDYKPYAQSNICLGEQAVFLRMWAFEVSPPQGSELRCVLYLFPGRPDTALSVSLYPEGGYGFSLLEKGAHLAINPPPGFALSPHNGEDLQGIYWGALATLPIDWLSEICDRPSLNPGDTFGGNFYKLCPGPEYEHSGSFFPADFPGDPYGAQSMGRFTVTPS